MGRDGRAIDHQQTAASQRFPLMIFTTQTNPRAKFNRWVEANPVVPFSLDEPKRPAIFTPRNRVRALTEAAVAEVYVMQLPTRPAA